MEPTESTSLSDGASPLCDNEFKIRELTPGQVRLVRVDEQDVAVYNIDGAFYATQGRCAHAGWPLNEGDVAGHTVTCPWHGWCFDVISGRVLRGAPNAPLQTYRVVVKDGIGRVLSAAPSDHPPTDIGTA